MLRLSWTFHIMAEGISSQAHRRVTEKGIRVFFFTILARPIHHDDVNLFNLEMPRLLWSHTCQLIFRALVIMLLPKTCPLRTLSDM